MRRAPLLPFLGCCVAALLALSACGSSRDLSDVPETRIEVRNDSEYQMSIYVIRENGPRIRLGDVSAFGEETLVIPPQLVRPLTSMRFAAEAIAGVDRSVSQEILVDPGDTVGLAIPPF